MAFQTKTLFIMTPRPRARALAKFEHFYSSSEGDR